MNKYFISTAIPYVNSDPHIGFALELIQADVLARYRRLKGDSVFFVTGTDENALKNAQAAEKAGEEVAGFVDKHAGKFLELTKILNLSNDDFIRTTEERHKKGAQKLWSACKPEDIYKKTYKGLYCIGCEEFKTKKDLVDGVCPEHKIEPEEVEEENYFFKLSRYEKELLKLIESDEIKITPASRKNETLEFIRGGLDDFSISRSRQRAKNWGIPVPGDDTQIMYVWFDALTNYINALGYGTDDARFNEFWNNGYRAHLVGKGITRFHAIYWPAMLLSAGLPVPKEIFIHGYVTAEGEKMSKSLGNVIDPFKVVEKYGTDVTRYYLLKGISSVEDGDFSYKKLEERYNGDLANGLGNLVQRVVTLIDSKLTGELIFKKELLEKDVEENIKEIFKKYIADLDNFLLHEAVGKTWELIAYGDKYMDEKAPWTVIKTNEQEFIRIMTNLLYIVYNISWMLMPFMPETADKIFKKIGADTEADTIENYKFRTVKSDGLFPRLK